MSTTHAPLGTLDVPTPDRAGGRPARSQDRSRRIPIMGATIGVILLLANGFVWATWGHFSGIPGWGTAELISGAVAVTFVVTTLLGFRFTYPALRTAYAISAAWLGALNYAVFAALGCWIIGGPWQLLERSGPPPYLAPVFFGAALLTSVYGLINAARIRVTRITVPLPYLPPAWQGRTVALVTDLHLGQIRGPAFLRRVLSRLRALRPDAVLISGDLFDGSPVGVDRLLADWEGFSADRGVFYVTGNHDEFAEREIYLRAAERVGIRVLNNEKVVSEGLQIVGVHDSEAEQPEVLRQVLRRAEIDPRRPSILLAHRPVNLAVAEAEGISLQLSGHTHSGQFWPWNLVVARIYGRFAHGLSRLGRLQVYTSSGVGSWGPPLRVGTKSEIVLIRLEDGDSSRASAPA
jgi:predicted MPP superfamily phosphohydrolase